ncbi:MAG: hypothetical protein O6705_04020 [Actinobacteria bacterium]|nr:hypothetical protein [Actinomycetota bacterium]
MRNATEYAAAGATWVGQSTHPDSGVDACDGFGEMQAGPPR